MDKQDDDTSVGNAKGQIAPPRPLQPPLNMRRDVMWMPHPVNDDRKGKD